MTLLIRDAVPSDREAIADLWVEAWRPVMPQIDFEARRAWLEEHLDGLNRAGTSVLAACRGARPVGFLTIEAGGYVDQLAVAPAEQGRGTARALLAAARQRCGRQLKLTVNRDNAGALAFYRHLGFVEAGRGVNPRSGLPTVDLVGFAT